MQASCVLLAKGKKSRRQQLFCAAAAQRSLILFGHIFANDNDAVSAQVSIYKGVTVLVCVCVCICVCNCVCATLFVLWARPPLGPSATLQPTFAIASNFSMALGTALSLSLSLSLSIALPLPLQLCLLL